MTVIQKNLDENNIVQQTDDNVVSEWCSSQPQNSKILITQSVH
jgi:hypothetical protein